MRGPATGKWLGFPLGILGDLRPAQ